MSDGAVTIRDVAREARVSVGTASMALAGHGAVKEQTRALVRDAARRLDYHRCVAAATLASRSHRRAGAVDHAPVAYLYWMPEGWHPEKHYEIGIEAARKRLDELGYGFIGHNLAAEADPAALARVLYSRGARGAILGAVHGPVMDCGFDWTLFPVVACERFSRLWHGHVVRAVHQTMAGFLAGRFLEMGCRRIAYCAGTHRPPREDDLAASGGAWSAVQYSQARVSFHLFPGTIKEIEAKKRFVRRIRPDAVIGFSAGDAVLAEACGLPASRFACLRLAPGAEVGQGPAGFVEPYEELAGHAVDLLDQQIRFRRPSVVACPVQIVVRPRFHPGPARESAG